MKSSLMDDIKTALKAGDKKRVGALRLIAAAIKQKEVDSRTELDEAGFTAVLEKMAKQRKESIKQYAQADRKDLLEQEEYELEIIEAYLPEQLSDAELNDLVDQVIQESGASSPKEIGKVMGLIKQSAAGRVDMGKASQKIKQKLADIAE